MNNLWVGYKESQYVVSGGTQTHGLWHVSLSPYHSVNQSVGNPIHSFLIFTKMLKLLLTLIQKFYKVV